MADGGRFGNWWNALLAPRKDPLEATRKQLETAEAFVDPARLFPTGTITAYNPSWLVSRKGMAIYDNMKRDEQVKRCLAFKKAAVLASGYEIVSPQKMDATWEVTEFVRAALVNFPGGWRAALKKVLTKLEYGYCLHGETLIHTLNGDVPIKTLVGQEPWVFSWKDGRLRLGKASRVWKTKTDASCVRVTYSWWAGGKRRTTALICTEEHPLMLRDGNYRTAGALRKGDRLMPFAQKARGRPRAEVQIVRGYGRSVWMKRAHWVLNELGIQVGQRDHAHHVNGNTLDDTPENLEMMSARDHVAQHTKEWFRTATNERKTERLARIAKSRSKIADVISAKSTAANIKTWADPIIRWRRIIGMTGKKHRSGWHQTPETRERISNAKRAYWAARRADNHEVVSVEPAGEHDVYDMTVPGFNNFAAAQIMVHNSVTEKVFATDAAWAPGKAVLHRMNALKPHYIDFGESPQGELLSVIQLPFAASLQRPLWEMPPAKFVVATHDKEFENHYGRSDLEAAYRAWWTKENAYKWYAVFLERYGMAPLVALYNQNAYQGSVLTALKSIVTKIQNATFAVVPRPSKDDLELWSQTLSADSRQTFLSALGRFDADIGAALLVPPLIGAGGDQTDSGAGQQGSYARSKTHFEAFLLAVREEQAALEDDVNTQVIRQLCDLNFAGLTSYPTMRCLPFGDELKLELYQLWKDMVAGKIVGRVEDDEVHIRKAFGMPENPDPELQPLAVVGKDGVIDKRQPGAEPQEVPEDQQSEEMRAFAEEHGAVWLRVGDETVAVARQ